MIDEIEFIKQEISKLPVNKNNHRRYPQSVKISAAKLAEQGMSTHKISIATGIHPTTLKYWSLSKKKALKPVSSFKEVTIKNEIGKESAKTFELSFLSGTIISRLSFSDLVQLLKMDLIK